MKNPLLIVAFSLTCVATAMAQSTTVYQVDNFDLSGVVKVEAPVPPQANEKKSSRLRKLTSSTNLNYVPGTRELNHVTSLELANKGLDGFTTGDNEVDSFIVDSGKRNSVDPLLLYSIMHQESTFKRGAISPKGARGLMQLMPGTAARFGVRNIFDPRQNIEGGARYVRFLLDQFDGNIPLTLAGYNAGEGAVMKYGNNVPPYAETREYVRRISKRYALIRDPLAAQNSTPVTGAEVSSLRKKEGAPLSMYERSVFAVRTPDGALQLVSQ